MSKLKFLMMLLLISTSITVAHAYDFESGGIYYNILSTTDKTVEVTYKDTEIASYSGQVYIPTNVTYEGVTYSITSIGENAFYDCTDLKSIEIPKSVTTIGTGAFRNVQFDELTIPENITYIGGNAFTGIINKLYFNAINCEYGRFNPKEIFFGDKVETIPNEFLRYSNELTEITIPESVKRIGFCAFQQVYKLKTLSIPSTVETIGYGLINNSSIEELIIEANIATISENLFLGDNNRNLKKIKITSPISTLPAGFLGAYRDLEEVILPKTLTSVSRGAFINCSSLTEITIPNNVEYLAFQCFVGSGLTTITLPKNLNRIGSMALYGNNNLTAIIVKNPNPSVFIDDLPQNYSGPVYDHFSNYTNVTLYVPKGSLQAYKTADVWKKFQNIVEYNPTEVNLIDGEEFVNDEPIENITVTYTRNYLSTGWHALYLPFDMAYDEWADYGVVAKLNNVHQYDTDNDGVLDKTTIEYNRVTSGNIRANTPYVFKPHAAGPITFTCEDRTVFAAPTEDAHVDCSTTEMLYTIYGNYQTKSGLKSMGAYALSSDGAFVQAKTESQTLKPYRIYLIISPRTDGGYVDAPMLRMPERVEVVVDGETTSIEDLFFSTQEENIYYDLMGRPVHNPSTGIYILNGRKVYIK